MITAFNITYKHLIKLFIQIESKSLLDFDLSSSKN